MTAVDEVRRFNRVYTRQIGLLDEHLPASDLTLPQARVLYELATGGEVTAAELTRRLEMDKGHVSRIVARFRARGLMTSRVSPHHGKHLLLSLTAEGQAAFAAMDAGTVAQMEAVLAPLDDSARTAMRLAMGEIQQAFGQARPDGEVVLRGLQPGDLGWIAHRQMRLYHREYGWDASYEGLVCRILGAFEANFDAEREAAWVAEADGVILGSIFLVQSDDPEVGKLRLLYVEPAARGRGVGAKLVAACVARARAVGYRRLTLWTQDILVSARRIYQAVGFELAAQASHHAFGHDLVEQTWTLELS